MRGAGRAARGGVSLRRYGRSPENGSATDNEAVCLIARAITLGSGALHQLATTGEVSSEIGGSLEAIYQLLLELAATWSTAFGGCCFRRRDKGPVADCPVHRL
jgi:hypothetical protein